MEAIVLRKRVPLGLLFATPVMSLRVTAAPRFWTLSDVPNTGVR